MRPTKRFQRLLSDPVMGCQLLKTIEQYECDICGDLLIHEWCAFFCTLPQPERLGLREFWHKRYDVCPACADAGVATFPDRLRKHAQELEETARELRQLVNAKWWQRTIPDATKACRADGNPPASPASDKSFAQLATRPTQNPAAEQGNRSEPENR
jgi:hypothetical protein